MCGLRQFFFVVLCICSSRFFVVRADAVHVKLEADFRLSPALWSRAAMSKSLRAGRTEANAETHTDSAYTAVAGQFAQFSAGVGSLVNTFASVAPRGCLILGAATVVFLLSLALAVILMRSFCAVCLPPSTSATSVHHGVKAQKNVKYAKCEEGMSTCLLGDKGQAHFLQIRSASYGANETTSIPQVPSTTARRADASADVCEESMPQPGANASENLSEEPAPLAEEGCHPLQDESEREEEHDQLGYLPLNSEFNMALSDSPLTTPREQSLMTPRGEVPQAGATRRQSRPSLSQWWERADDGEGVADDNAHVADLATHDSPCTTPKQQCKTPGEKLLQRRKRHSLSDWWGADDEKIANSPSTPSVLEGASPLRRHANTRWT